MSANINVYGNGANVSTHAYGTNLFPAEKWATFISGNTSVDGSHFRAGYQQSKLTLNNIIDTSICPSGINPNSQYSNYTILRNINASTVELTTINENKVKRWFPLYERYAVPEKSRLTAYSAANGLRVGRNQTMSTVNSYGSYTYHSPLVSLHPKNFIMFVFVGLYDSNNNIKYVELSQLNNYIGNYMIGAYSAIANVGWYENTSTRAMQWYGSYNEYRYGIGLIDPFEFGETYGDSFHDVINLIHTGLSQQPSVIYGNNNTRTVPAVNCIYGFNIDTNSSTPYVSAYNNTFLGLGVAADEVTVDIVSTANTYSYIRPKIKITEYTYSKIMSAAAHHGLFFTDTLETAISGLLTDENMYLGILNGQGISTGQYSHGSENEEQIQYSWDNAIEDTIYNGTTDYDYNDYNLITDLPNSFSTTGAFYGKLWILSEHTLYNFLDEIISFSSSSQTFPTDSSGYWAAIVTENNKKSKTAWQNATDCFISLIKFPFDIPTDLLPYGNITIGLWESEYSAHQYSPLVDGAKYTGVITDSVSAFLYPLNHEYVTFLDFEPYTTVQLIVPYCGTIEIPCAVFMNHTVTVRYVVDFLTGDCTALIMCDELAYSTLTGNCAERIPVSGYQIGSYAETRSSLAHQVTTEKFGAATAILGGLAGSSISATSGSTPNVVGMIGQAALGVVNAAQHGVNADYYQNKLEHSSPQVSRVQSASPSNGFLMEQVPRLIIQRPIFLDGFDLETYVKYKGYRCSIMGQVRDFRGYLQMVDINLDGINCTSTEKEMIIAALQEGVILDD